MALHWQFLSITLSQLMFAFVDIAGFQEKVEKGMKMHVPSLEGEKGAKVVFDKVMLLSEDGKTAIVGKPYIAGAKVEATIVLHGKDDKIVVRKFKRRKRYHRTLRGHRQGYTEIEITGISK